jgi:hypothetical protein
MSRATLVIYQYYVFIPTIRTATKLSVNSVLIGTSIIYGHWRTGLYSATIVAQMYIYSVQTVLVGFSYLEGEVLNMHDFGIKMVSFTRFFLMYYHPETGI